MVQEYSCITAAAAKGFCVLKPCPKLHWVNHRNYWRQQEISCLCGRGGNFSKGAMKSLAHVGHRLHFAYVTLAGLL